MKPLGSIVGPDPDKLRLQRMQRAAEGARGAKESAWFELRSGLGGR
jgi:hypothetical protein